MTHKANTPASAGTTTSDSVGSAALQKLRQPVPQEFDIRIAADGSWFHEGGLIGRPALVKLFASVLRREVDGSYWLVTPVERGRISVDDAPFIGVSATIGGTGREQRICITTNVGDEVQIGSEHPLTMRVPETGGSDLRPYVMVRNGLQACLSRPVFYELAALSAEGPNGGVGIWSNGEFFGLDGTDPS